MQTKPFRAQYISAAVFVIVAFFSYLSGLYRFTVVWACLAVAALLYSPTLNNEGRLTIRPDSRRNTASLVFLGIALIAFSVQVLFDARKFIIGFSLP